MIVEIKKAKITASIITQMLLFNIEKTDYNVLGWCVFNKTKHIVLYNQVTKDLRRYLMPDAIKCTESKGAFSHDDNEYITRLHLNVKTTGYNPLVYDALNKEHQDRLYENVTAIKAKALELGQFYI